MGKECMLKPYAPSKKKRTRDSQPRYSSINIENWRTALSTVGGMSGLELKKFNEDEGELLENVINSVSQKMIKPRFEVAEYPIGLDEKINDFENKRLALQRQQTDKPQVIGIVGMGGIRKTTLAKELFNRKSSQYNRSYMLFDVRENARKKSLESLQNKLLEGLTGQNGKIENVSEGIQLLKSRLLSSQALVILDDVDHVNQLDALLRPIRDVLQSNSLILITSRDRDVLKRLRVEESSIYTLTGLNPQQSQELFCLHAFTQPHPLPGFEHLVDKFLTACDRLPLSLKVFGGLLYGNHEKPFWEDQLERLEQILPEDIKTRLQVSYDLLQDDEKQIFLDIACFFIGERRDTAIRIWDRSGWKGSLGFRSLQNKSLVEVGWKGSLGLQNKSLVKVDSGVNRYDRTEIRIIMHDHLRDLGRDLAKNPTLPRRIWRNEDLDDLLQQQSGVTQVRGISMRVTNWKAPSFSGCIMNNLQLLDVQGSIHSCDSREVTMNEVIMNALQSSNLIWLRLEHHRFFSLPSRIPSMKLTVLEVDSYHSLSLIWSALVQEESQISFSGLRSLSDSFSNLHNINLSSGRDQIAFGNLAYLQHINMSGCWGLEQLPDGFGNLANLQHLDMSGCSGLKQLPDGFGNLANLQHIDMSGCSGLKQLPDGFGVRNFSSV
eukprot:PITA_31501